MVSTLDWTDLLLPISRAQYLVTCPIAEIEQFATDAQQRTEAAGCVISGSWCPRKKDAIWEIGLAMGFPQSLSHSGHWKSLRQGLLDLRWMPASAYTLFITQTDRLLDESEEEFAQLMNVLRSVMRERNRWDERALHMTSDRVPLHVVFHCEREHRQATIHRLRAAGMGLKVAVPWSPAAVH